MFKVSLHLVKGHVPGVNVRAGILFIICFGQTLKPFLKYVPQQSILPRSYLQGLSEGGKRPWHQLALKGLFI